MTTMSRGDHSVTAGGASKRRSSRTTAAAKGMRAVREAAPKAAARPPREVLPTREHILNVATSEFSAKGYDGARVDEIVAKCGVSKNLIYHYFDSKECLFIAVMERAYTRMRLRQSEWRFADLTPQKGMERLVVFTFRHFIEDPAIISLLNSENLHKAKHIAQSSSIPQLYDPLLQAIRDLLERGQQAGVFRSDVDPVDFYITLSGMGYFYLSNQYTLGHVFRQDLLRAKRLKQRQRHMIDVVLGYLRA
jgi:TetR/AcrR family transcriptional regulator